MIRKETKGNFNNHSPAFAYFVPDKKKTIKVEKVFHSTYVAHFCEGSERISLKDMRENGWECKGKWELVNENV